MLVTRKRANPPETPVEAQRRVQETVASMIEAIRDRGDEAVREYSEKFDDWSPESFRLTPEQIEEIVAGVPRR